MIEAYAQVCMGILRWTPRDFWSATLWDVTQAIEGLRISNGGDRKKPQLTGNEVQELKRLALDEKRRDLNRAGNDH